jgi:hypothetical protein
MLRAASEATPSRWMVTPRRSLPNFLLKAAATGSGNLSPAEESSARRTAPGSPRELSCGKIPPSCRSRAEAAALPGCRPIFSGASKAISANDHCGRDSSSDCLSVCLLSFAGRTVPAAFAQIEAFAV